MTRTEGEAGDGMTDRKAVITHLQIIHIWAEFAYERDLQFFTPKHLKNIAEWADDALELLKAQETVEPKMEPSAKGYWFTCGVCGWWLFEVRDTVHFDDRKRIHFCASCGRSVKWE